MFGKKIEWLKENKYGDFGKGGTVALLSIAAETLLAAGIDFLYNHIKIVKTENKEDN